VKSLQALAAELESTWHREIPLAAAIDVRVASCAPGELVVHAPHEPNRNVHGTAFAGSLFSVCVLTGWGMTWLALAQRGQTGLIVVADSRIQYSKAVTGDIACRCAVEPATLDAAVASYSDSGRARLPLVCTIDSNGKRAVTFEAEYVVHARRH
jgi:thioesterase domain-containing protein